MRQEQISRTERARQARRVEQRRSQRSDTAELGTVKGQLGGGGADVDEDLLRRISLLIDASAHIEGRPDRSA